MKLWQICMHARNCTACYHCQTVKTKSMQFVFFDEKHWLQKVNSLLVPLLSPLFEGCPKNELNNSERVKFISTSTPNQSREQITKTLNPWLNEAAMFGNIAGAHIFLHDTAAASCLWRPTSLPRQKMLLKQVRNFCCAQLCCLI